MKKIIAVVLMSVVVSNAFCSAVLAETKVNAGLRVPIYAVSLQTSKNTTSGAIIDAEIARDVKVNDVVVFKQGDSATINVSNSKKARCWGIPGEIYLANGTAQDVNGITRPIEVSYQITGEEKTYPKILGVVSIFFLFPLALFGFVHGGQAEVLPNKTINTYLSSDFSL